MTDRCGEFIMATLSKRGSSWRAIVRMNGVSISATRDTRAEAKAWAAAQEARIIAGTPEPAPTKKGRPAPPVIGKVIPGVATGDLFERYARELSPQRGG